MSLTITAVLVDPQGKPLPALDAQVCTFAQTGAARTIGTGRSGADGRLSITCTWTASADCQPRVQLQLKRGSAFVEASENPAKFAGATCDFGTVTFDTTPARASAPAAAAAAATTAAAVARPGAGGVVLPRPAESEDLQARVAALDQTRITLERRVTELESEKEGVRADLTGRHAQELQARDAELAKREAKIRTLSDQLAAIKDTGMAETSIQDLAQTTAEQLQRVQSSLRIEQAGFRLGKVALQLKVLPGRTGGNVTLPAREDIEKVGAGALSVLDLAFHPDTAVPSGPPRPAVPRVVGYTEALARRKLAERRLGVEVTHQLVTSAAEHGRVVLQRPAAGAQVAEGTVVLIAIGRQG